VAAAKGKHIATMLDTKGPEIRTAMLRGHTNIEIEKGQEVKIVAVGTAYTSFEGYKDAATGETVIGLSYDKLCQHVKPGGRILVADGSLAIEVGCAGTTAFGAICLCVVCLDAHQALPLQSCKLMPPPPNPPSPKRRAPS
jgi:pyruvate kinase